MDAPIVDSNRGLYEIGIIKEPSIELHRELDDQEPQETSKQPVTNTVKPILKNLTYNNSPSLLISIEDNTAPRLQMNRQTK